MSRITFVFLNSSFSSVTADRFIKLGDINIRLPLTAAYLRSDRLKSTVAEGILAFRFVIENDLTSKLGMAVVRCNHFFCSSLLPKRKCKPPFYYCNPENVVFALAVASPVASTLTTTVRDCTLSSAG